MCTSLKRAWERSPGLTTFEGNDEGPLSWSPDGSLIAYRQAQDPKYFGYGGGFGTVAVISPNGGAPRFLTAALDRVVTGSRWSRDGKSIIGTEVDDEHQYLVRIRVDGSGVDRVASSVPVIGAFSEGADGAVAALGSSPSEPNEIFAVEPNGATRQLTHHNAWLNDIALATTTSVVSKSDDGTEVHGILRVPAGAVAGHKLPMIVRVHGGPAGQDALDFDFEKELLAASGWAVLAPNYRGSSGRGASYTIAIAGDWCNKEVRDIHGMVDALVKSGVADEQHLGVGGWSYGGVLTDCLIASDTRFKAATSGAGVSDVFAMYGHDQYVVQYDLELGQPWKNVDKWLKISTAFFHADKIKTPTLFLGGSLDANVPVLGGEQMYQALKSLGVESELIVYPGEYHGIRRPSFQRDRLERYVAWYAKYLATAQ
jgi:dipeptidyl aminopeptidase/acylaminoacyl peptidase